MNRRLFFYLLLVFEQTLVFYNSRVYFISFLVAAEVFFNLFQRTALGFGNEFEGEKKAQNPQCCKDEEGRGKTKGGEEHGE